MTLTIRVLAGLVAGFLLGLALAGPAAPASTLVVGILAPVGEIFVNLIRMTVIPLLASMLVAGIGGMPRAGGLGRTGLRGLAISVALLTMAAAVSVVVAQPVLARLDIDPSAAQALRAQSGVTGADAAAAAPTLGSWLVELVPVNVVQAAADGAVLPVILFSVLFGWSLNRIEPGRHEAVLRVVEGVAETMQRLVVGVWRWRRSASSRWRCLWPPASAGGCRRRAGLRRPRGGAHRYRDRRGALPARRARRSHAPGRLRRLLRAGARPSPSPPGRRWPRCRPWWPAPSARACRRAPHAS
ncbi:MAG: cation:dicarboxylase symporter family transporter [Vicinamibacterales bacterium]